MSSEFVIKKDPKGSVAKIFLGKEEIAEIKQGEGFSFKLIKHKDKMEWIVNNFVDGEHRPFSFSVRKREKKNIDQVTDKDFTEDRLKNEILNNYTDIKVKLFAKSILALQLRESAEQLDKAIADIMQDMIKIAKTFPVCMG